MIDGVHILGVFIIVFVLITAIVFISYIGLFLSQIIFRTENNEN